MIPQRYNVCRLFILLSFLTASLAAFGQSYCGLENSTVPIPSPTSGAVIVPSHYSTFTSPSSGYSSYTEPDIVGTTSTCVVWGATNGLSETGQAVTMQNYATQNPFNADDSLISVANTSGTNYIVKNPALGNGGGVVVSPNNMPASTTWIIVWDTANPAVFYYGQGSSVMKGTIGGTSCNSSAKWSGAPNCTVTTTTLYTSPSYSNLQFNEQDVSADGLHFWIADAGQDTGSTVHFLLMTLNSTNATSATLTATVTLDGTGGKSLGYHKPGILPNNYLFINPDSGNDALYNTSGNLVINTLQSQGGHADFGTDPVTGKIVGVSVWYQGTSANGCTDGSYYGGVGLLDLQPGDSSFNTVIRCLSLNSPENYSGLQGGGWHYSWRDTSANWIVSDMITAGSGCPSSSAPQCFNSMQPSTSNWDARQEEIVAWNAQGTEIMRLVHHRSREGGNGGGYWSQPRPAISRDGQYIAFTSNFNISSGDSVEGTTNVFVIPFQVGSVTPPNPPTGLSANVSQ